MTLRQKAADSDHIPCVLIEKDTPPSQRLESTEI